MKDFSALVLQYWMLSDWSLVAGLWLRNTASGWHALTPCEISHYVDCGGDTTPPDEPFRNVTPMCCPHSRHTCCFVQQYDTIKMLQERVISQNKSATFHAQNATPDTFWPVPDLFMAAPVQRPADSPVLHVLMILICCACASMCLKSFLRLRRRTTVKQRMHAGKPTAAPIKAVVARPVIDVTGGGDYIVDVKPNWNLKTKPDHHVPATKDTVPATTDTVPATTDTVPATTDIVTLEETTRPAACKIVPRRLVRRLIKQNASMRVRNFRDRQRIVKFEKEIKLKSNRNMALFMCVKEEMARVMNLDQQLCGLDTDNTTLADRLEKLKKNYQQKKDFLDPSIKAADKRERRQSWSTRSSSHEPHWRNF